ncbi:30S ribosomal protein S20 [Bullifex porci]|uniref:Small ribosomal subunit protein bS20 n=1 Tax=Bullifex porci TaxID=2606638 RepID=A0A7X2PB01_9SPIO|nr:30S ribosomal protein S20 [Bullifex porci]MDD7256136.1 30S ribosomal protein S20 [Bullifex porci]MDD7589346.1 30S ribosomal protein S20 [Bullifex porci]MDY2741064.1 30S ribosomal protein S20 [Bullifex porci]MSU05533.1 30S ribosomal protein S20 [Bullifex porci]
MANRSAEKRERQNVKRRMHNRMIKSSVRTQIKKFDAAVQAKDKDAAKTAMDLSFKLLDSAASKGVLHKNTASRKKSRLYKAFAKLA